MVLRHLNYYIKSRQHSVLSNQITDCITNNRSAEISFPFQIVYKSGGARFSREILVILLDGAKDRFSELISYNQPSVHINK
jgi:hypothetical protein